MLFFNECFCCENTKLSCQNGVSGEEFAAPASMLFSSRVCAVCARTHVWQGSAFTCLRGATRTDISVSFFHCCLTEVIFTLLFLSVASFTSSFKNVACLVPYMNLIFQGNSYNFKCLSYFFCSESWQEGNRKENLKVWRSFHPEFVQR